MIHQEHPCRDVVSRKSSKSIKYWKILTLPIFRLYYKRLHQGN